MMLVQRQTLRIVLWRWLWLREAILPSRVMLNNMKQRGKHLVLHWIRPRGKLRWERVKRWWEGCLIVECTNGDIRGKKVGRSGFRFLYGGLMFGWWAFVQSAFVPLPGQVYPKEKLIFFFLSRQELELFSFLFFLGHCFTEVFQSVYD